MNTPFRSGTAFDRSSRRLTSLTSRAVGWSTLLVLSGIAQAGMTVEVTDQCSNSDHSAAAEARDARAVTQEAVTAPEDVVIRDYAGNPTRWGCAKVTVVHPKNVSEGPAVGATEAAVDLSDEDQQTRLESFYQLIQSAITIRQLGSFKPYNFSVLQCPLPDAQMRGSGFEFKRGVAMGLTHSPEFFGTFAFFEPTRQITNVGPLGIPFVVVNADRDDWLEFSNRGVVFWKARVTDFKPGQLHFAVVSDTIRNQPHGVWGIYLNMALASNSIIYVPTQPPPPIPAPLKAN